MADDKLKEIHEQALKRFDRVQNKEKNQRALAVEDARFAQTEDGQWDEDAIRKRAGRPRYTINRVAGAIDQLVGDQRQNSISIKVDAVGRGATENVAKVFEGLIRNIESLSGAEDIYICAYDEAVNGGYGGWRITTDFSDDSSFEQEIFIEPILSTATSLWFDVASQKYDRSDAGWAFFTIDMPKEEHKDRFPDSPAAGWNQDTISRRNFCQQWFDEDSVRVAEYWVKTPVSREIALLSDGRVIDLDDEKDALDELRAQGITIVKQRTVDSHKVEMYLMDGSGILEGPKEWAGKFIPLVPMYGRQAHIEGETFTRGIVRFAKDANRIYNYTTSAAIETAALTPKDPIWHTPRQSEGLEGVWANFNTSNDPFMPFNPDPDSPGVPQRGGAPAVQGAFLQQIEQASRDLYHVTNMQPPSLGANPELKSGKAIQSQERLGDRGSYIYTDNLEKSVAYTGKILIDLIPRIYDTERQIRIASQADESEQVTINQTVFDRQTGKKVIVNDLSLGKYDVKTRSGPAFATQRQESAEQLIQLVTGSPAFEALAMDLIAKDLPILESKELAKRVRRQMILSGTVEPTEDEIQELGLDKPQQPDPTQQALTENIQMQTEKMISDIESQDADTQKTVIETQNAAIKAYKDLIDALSKQAETGIPLTEQDHDVRVKQQDIIRESQQAIDPGPNSEQAADIAQLVGVVPTGQGPV